MIHEMAAVSTDVLLIQEYCKLGLLREPFIFLVVATGTISKLSYKSLREISFAKGVNNRQDAEAIH